MTTANKITIFRILLVPFFCVQLLYYESSGQQIHRWLAIVTFALASISDAVDGYIARTYNQRSELGAILDPLADKLLLVSALVLLALDHTSHVGQIPFWLVATVFSRDLLILIGMGVIHYTCGKVTVRPRLIGKIATVFQMATVLWALFRWKINWLEHLAMVAALCTGISGVLYVMDGIRQLASSPKSSATPPATP
ncbi:MAG TPA: CDP-diacylglycerol--glycerol-3-phosphate 3-phosphatidyltransferase [Candidatus Paceibacterota bacterium]|nr:CDP-diacylglycerol--glycerol-3-phosphate 3-phosphatidyltransferase [Verrucomicrobiota bacterium]HRY47782.1 CDP-diacylglycerol--glycerol-3-phosphate 3-phosphatidyltransferase [Candidatus Paceibacterota bacterium]